MPPKILTPVENLNRLFVQTFAFFQHDPPLSAPQGNYAFVHPVDSDSHRAFGPVGGAASLVPRTFRANPLA
jgi:hypothetical protein